MFKVGDWVRHKENNNIYQVKGFSIHGQTKGFLQVPDEYNLLPSSECELWQPKEDEWCWIGKNLSKIVAHDRDGYFTCLTSSGTYTAYMKLEYIYEIAEPFIGELPSFIKE